jgi:glycine C-acetyltransferase/8-amino-7-oxononanoate synthase
MANENYRLESPIGPRMTINGREVDYFCGTGYLCLQSHPDVIRAGEKALHQYGLSTAASRGGFGEHPVYDELDGQACRYFGAEKALFFPSGYMGMSILLQTDTTANDHIFIDTGAHYSLWDAAQASTKVTTVFRHRSPEDLTEQIRANLQPGERPLVISDAVFPVSGEIAPLPDYLSVLESYNGRVFLDDAHGVGVLGEHGRGILDHFNLTAENVKICGTLAKALGGYGGIISGPTEWIDRVDQNSGVLTGASPLPLVTAAASAKALEIARLNPELHKHLWINVKQARDGLRSAGWELEDTPVPIICLPARKGFSPGAICRLLFEQGIAADYVRNYTSTPSGGALRVAISALHSAEQIDRLVETIQKLT